MSQIYCICLKCSDVKTFQLGLTWVTTLSILCSGKVSVSAQSCQTTGGNVVGASCVFPFTYQGVQYNFCTFDGGSDQPWCSTGTDQNGNYITDIWGYCGPNCSLFQQTTDTTNTASTASTTTQLSHARQDAVHAKSQRPSYEGHCWCRSLLLQWKNVTLLE